MTDHAEDGSSTVPAGTGQAQATPNPAATVRPADSITQEAQDDQSMSRKALISRDLNDIYLLLDHLSGRADRHISTLQIDQPNTKYDRFNLDEKQPAFLRRNLIQSVCEIEWPPKDDSQYSSIAATTLFTARDLLNDIAAPASGMTIAFTIMTTARFRESVWPLHSVWQSRAGTGLVSRSASQSKESPAHTATTDGGNGGKPPNEHHDRTRKYEDFSAIDQTALARKAYPHLEAAAQTLGRVMQGYIRGLLVCIAFTAFLSWNVTSGKFIIERLNSLKLRAAAQAARIVTADEGSTQSVTSPTGTSDDVPDGASTLDTECVAKTGLAVRQVSTLAATSTVTADALCEAGFAIMAQRQATDVALRSWLAGWSWLPLHVGTLPDAIDTNPLLPNDEAHYNRVMVRSNALMEQEAGDLNSVLASYVLPMLYGLLGATAAVIRNLTFKMRESTLAPRDITTSRVQQLLGIMIGACIGLFVSPTGAPEAHLPNVTLAGNAVALSASAFAFLAGFGVEAVFKWLETVIAIAFAAGGAVGGAAANAQGQARAQVASR